MVKQNSEAGVSTENKVLWCNREFYLFIWVLRHFQHCAGHITTGSWKARGNQYITFTVQFVSTVCQGSVL